MNGGDALLRRGYSFTDGLDDRLGQLDAGLFFLSFQRDPAAFVRVQRRLGSERQAQRVHQARRLGRVGRPARRAAGRVGGGDPARSQPPLMLAASAVSEAAGARTSTGTPKRL